MTNETPSAYQVEMQRGHDARDARGNHDRAVNHYLLAESEATNATELAQARQAAGVSYRVLGNIDDAFTSLEKALSTAPRDDHRLIGAINRDLGEVHHDHALQLVEEGDIEAAEEAFDLAEACFGESSDQVLEAGDLAEYLSTQGFWGMAQFDRGLRSWGIIRIKRATQGFRALEVPHPTYEINTLIRLMRCSFIWRWVSLPHALRLTRKGSPNRGSRKKVFAALGGNKIFLKLKQRQQGN